MSAFVVSDEHINYLVNAAAAYNIHCTEVKYNGMRADYTTADNVGTYLLRENLISVNYRYPHHEAIDPETVDFRLRPLAGTKPVQVLKAIDCYEYQSCEHPGWDTSAAKKFCDQLRAAAIIRLAGYDEAAWEIRFASPLQFAS